MVKALLYPFVRSKAVTSRGVSTTQMVLLSRRSSLTDGASSSVKLWHTFAAVYLGVRLFYGACKAQSVLLFHAQHLIGQARGTLSPNAGQLCKKLLYQPFQRRHYTPWPRIASQAEAARQVQPGKGARHRGHALLGGLIHLRAQPRSPRRASRSSSISISSGLQFRASAWAVITSWAPRPWCSTMPPPAVTVCGWRPPSLPALPSCFPAASVPAASAGFHILLSIAPAFPAFITVSFLSVHLHILPARQAGPTPPASAVRWGRPRRLFCPPSDTGLSGSVALTCSITSSLITPEEYSLRRINSKKHLCASVHTRLPSK